MCTPPRGCMCDNIGSARPLPPGPGAVAAAWMTCLFVGAQSRSLGRSPVVYNRRSGSLLVSHVILMPCLLFHGDDTARGRRAHQQTRPATRFSQDGRGMDFPTALLASLWPSISVVFHARALFRDRAEVVVGLQRRRRVVFQPPRVPIPYRQTPTLCLSAPPPPNSPLSPITH